MTKASKQVRALIVLTTCPSVDVANHLATELVKRQLAGCVNIIPDMVSVYQWKNEIKHDKEALLLIKSTASQYPQLEQMIKAQHPYELPEIIAVSIEDGLPAYLQWLNNCCQQDD